MIKNGKFFVEPQPCSDNFKALFARLAAQGAGRPVDRHEVANGPWTPETLADAISAIDSNRAGIDVRTVQVWFQANHNGISDKNIHWLARVFGCNDPVATSQWQSELKAAKERLSSERRKQRKLVSPTEEQPTTSIFAQTSEDITTDKAVTPPETMAQRHLPISNFATKSEGLFLGGAPFGMFQLVQAA